MLTDIKVRNFKPKDKLYRRADSHGLTIEINPNGSKIWRHRYRYNNKATMMSLGHYPEVTLLDARQERDNNKQLLKKGINPRRAQSPLNVTKPTFIVMFDKWIDSKKDDLTPGYVEDTIQRANNYLMPTLGKIPLEDIKSPDMRDLLLKIQDTGKLDMLKKVKGIANGVFSYAVSRGIISVNPVRDLPNDIFKKKRNNHYATQTDPKGISWLLSKLEQHNGSFEVNSALLLAPHLFLRPGELAGLLWSEVDFDAKLIRISPSRMKMSRAHLVPLSHQSLEILSNLNNHEVNSEFVFPSSINRNKSITTSALRLALRSVGVGKDKFTTHGFRHMASTRLNEIGYRGDLIEIQLAHIQTNKVRAAYNHAEHLEERKLMMQEWSDYLDKLKASSKEVVLKEENKKKSKSIKFIDLFAGLGGTRIGFESACKEIGIESECVYTSEIKSFAVDIYKHNFKGEDVAGDITKVSEKELPDFDYLLGGFPCQAFSTAGKKAGFDDARGTLFFDIARILKEKRPKGFLLENVEGLVVHDKKNKSDAIGNTLGTILTILKEIGYKVHWKVLNSEDFGVPQIRKRIYIVGALQDDANLESFDITKQTFGDIQEHNLPALESTFTKRLLKLYSPKDLAGKSIKDKRGGENNIHSWDLELKGKLTQQQKDLMGVLLKERRKKIWAELKGIAWMDGMSLTLDEIHSFYGFVPKEELKEWLDDLVDKKYVRFEHPKDIVVKDDGSKVREFATNKEKGYNIVTGKLSFELNKILGENSVVGTIVATEASSIGVLDNGKIRRMSERECFRFFGFPEWYESNISHKDLFDLIGNTVVIPVIEAVSNRLLKASL